MSDHPIWILVADGQHARVLERSAPNADWLELEDDRLVNPTPPSRELGTDRPGRGFESGGTARHAIAPRRDLHEEAEFEFARLVLERIERSAQEKLFRRLFIMAPPRFLGYLRDGLGQATRLALRGTLNRDFTKAPVAEIVSHLHEHTPFDPS